MYIIYIYNNYIHMLYRYLEIFNVDICIYIYMYIYIYVYIYNVTPDRNKEGKAEGKRFNLER